MSEIKANFVFAIKMIGAGEANQSIIGAKIIRYLVNFPYENSERLFLS